MRNYRRMTDPGCEGHLLIALPICGNDDRPPKYEYKDKLSKTDDIWEWEKRDGEYWHKYSNGCYSEKAFRDPDASMDFPDDKEELRNEYWGRHDYSHTTSRSDKELVWMLLGLIVVFGGLDILLIWLCK